MVINIIGIVRDVTEKKRADEEQRRLEAQLQRAERLESVGILASGMAHDFNNILTRILGNIDIAKDELQPGTDIYKILSEAEEGCKTAKELTQRFRSFTEEVEPKKEMESLGGPIKKWTNDALLGSVVKREFLIPEDLWLIECNKELMNQVIHNLMLNALEAMPEGGTVRVCAENITIDAEKREPGLSIKEGRYVRISIQDEGVGIPEEHLSRIFDPYFSTKERGIQQGMGLGLAIAYSVLEKHGGYIYVDSREGVGTTVYIYLPASKEDIQEEE